MSASRRIDQDPLTDGPRVGQVVLYRSRAGIDLPGIVTALAPGSDGAVHLHLFPSPTYGADILDHEWGTARADDDAPAALGTWRPLEDA